MTVPPNRRQWTPRRNFELVRQEALAQRSFESEVDPPHTDSFLGLRISGFQIAASSGHDDTVNRGRLEVPRSSPLTYCGRSAGTSVDPREREPITVPISGSVVGVHSPCCPAGAEAVNGELNWPFTASIFCLIRACRGPGSATFMYAEVAICHRLHRRRFAVSGADSGRNALLLPPGTHGSRNSAKVDVSIFIAERLSSVRASLRLPIQWCSSNAFQFRLFPNCNCWDRSRRMASFDRSSHLVLPSTLESPMSEILPSGSEEGGL